VYGVRKGSNFILLHVAVQISQHHLSAPFIEEAVFAPLYILASFVKNMGAWVYSWAFYFVSLVYISVFMLVPYCLNDCSFLV